MQLPIPLREAIEKITDSLPLKELLKASESLSSLYREGKQGSSLFMTTKVEKIAYLAARMPATYAAIFSVMRELQARVPSFLPKSFLDLGSGPGTGLWAAMDLFPQIEKYFLLEKDPAFISIGKELFFSASETSPHLEWIEQDFQNSTISFPGADMVLFSYALGEGKESLYEKILEKAWRATNEVLLVIEPGTPVGYKKIMKIREVLYRLGGHLLAPCPHSKQCPLYETKDWCHFSARIERSSLHRKIKLGSLNYEDEKFSYVIFHKRNIESNFSKRILRRPIHNSGHVNLTLCTKEGIEKKTVSKKEGELFKKIKKLDCGDAI